MYDFISLNLNCPTCGKSLMDEEYMVDNKPGIKLTIKIDDKEGNIWLSSIYGSYNFLSEIKTSLNEVADLSCPHCKTKIPSNANCDTCNAPMANFYLDVGGKVNICSRIGCKDHFVEFEDLSLVLKSLYQEHGFIGRPFPKDEKSWRGKHITENKEEEDEKKEIIQSGTFLQTYCPHCNKSLNENDMLKLKVDKGNNESGFIYASPYLNVYNAKSSIFLHEREAVGDLKCTHCDKSFMVEDKNCEKCSSPIAKISVGARTKLVDFYICSKKGCRWHGLNEEDMDNIRLEDSMEW